MSSCRSCGWQTGWICPPRWSWLRPDRPGRLAAPGRKTTCTRYWTTLPEPARAGELPRQPLWSMIPTAATGGHDHAGPPCGLITRAAGRDTYERHLDGQTRPRRTGTRPPAGRGRTARSRPRRAGGQSERTGRPSCRLHFGTTRLSWTSRQNERPTFSCGSLTGLPHSLGRCSSFTSTSRYSLSGCCSSSPSRGRR